MTVPAESVGSVVSVVGLDVATTPPLVVATGAPGSSAPPIVEPAIDTQPTDPSPVAPASPPEPTADVATSAPPLPAASDALTTELPHRAPLADGVSFSYGRDHHDYPASDIFAECGAEVVAPITGILLEVRSVDAYDPAVDNPATRGGKSISLLGDDGVRYYMAHLAETEPTLAPDQRVAIGQRLGTVGSTGRASGCHVHFALSPPCGGKEWAVRRGVVWPWPYLDAWQTGETRSPALEVVAWQSDHPDACAAALADLNAGDS